MTNMKVLISVLVGIGVFLFCIFVVDAALVDWVMDAIPASAGQWMKLIHVGVWLVTISFTAALSFAISMFIGALVLAMLD